MIYWTASTYGAQDFVIESLDWGVGFENQEAREAKKQERINEALRNGLQVYGYLYNMVLLQLLLIVFFILY